MDFQPKILGILCHWCSYSAADAAGSARMKIASNLRVIRVMCSGRVDPMFVLQAFAKGMDGVLICGCRPHDCHYLSGNYKAAFRISLLSRLIEQFAIDKRRLRLAWISAADGRSFSNVVNEMTEIVHSLGPLEVLAKVEHGT